MARELYIARGDPGNVKASLIVGVEAASVSRFIGELPSTVVDEAGRVRVWGVPGSRSLSAWLSLKRGDVVVVIENEPRRGARSAVVAVAEWKYPTNPDDGDQLSRARALSREIWKPFKPRHRRTEIPDYPYLIFFSARLFRTLNVDEVLEKLGLDKRSLVGFRQSLNRVRRVDRRLVEELYRSIVTLPSIKEVYRILEEAYLAHSGGYGAPVFLGGEWGGQGLFEEVNKRLEAMGYRPLTWSEFKGLLDSIEAPGRVEVAKIVNPKTGRVEPKTLIIHEPVKLD